MSWQTSWRAALLGCGLFACDDSASIGAEHCAGAETRCDAVPEDERLSVEDARLQEVRTADPGELAVVWERKLVRVPFCNLLRLVASADGVWLMLFPSPFDEPLRVQRYGERGEPGEAIPLGPLKPGYSYDASRPLSDGAGGLVLHVNDYMSRANAGGLERPPVANEVIHVGSAGELARIDVPWRVRGSVLAHGVLPWRDGFVLYQSTNHSDSLRMVDGEGSTVWQQVGFPAWTALLGAAHGFSIAPAGDGVVVLSWGGGSVPDQFGSGIDTASLLQMDEAGNLKRSLRFTFNWSLSPSLLALPSGRFAVAGLGGQYTGALLEPTPQDIYVLKFDDDLAPSGFRVTRETYAALPLQGLTADARDTLYLSSRVGARDDERGLLCRLPAEGEPACYRTEPALFLYDIAVGDGGQIYAVSDDKLLRLQLPE